MVRLLLGKGANPKFVDEDRWTPLHLAALKRSENLIGLLRDHVDNNEEILSWVNLQRQDRRKQALLEEAAEKKGEASTVVTGLRAAIQERQFGRSQLLLDRGADVPSTLRYGQFTHLCRGRYPSFHSRLCLSEAPWYRFGASSRSSQFHGSAC
jgi:ankyrin repeat protein